MENAIVLETYTALAHPVGDMETPSAPTATLAEFLGDSKLSEGIVVGNHSSKGPVTLAVLHAEVARSKRPQLDADVDDDYL